MTGPDDWRHSDAAYDWYNNPNHDKAYFANYTRKHGVEIARVPLRPGNFASDWADVAMTLFDIHGDN